METHAEHFHKAPSGGWKHYFLEFFMLFLAVSAGFYAENLRDSRNDRERGKQYIKMLVEDLKDDTIQLNNLLTTRKVQLKVYDSLYLLLNRPDKNKIGDSLYTYAKKAGVYFFYVEHDRTLQQLKNSGSMRLIENATITDSLLSLDLAMRSTKGRSDDGMKRADDFRALRYKIFDNRVFYTTDLVNTDSIFTDRKINGNPQLISSDTKDINELIGLLRSVRAGNNISIFFEQNLLKMENEILPMLQKEYHLENKAK